MPICRPVVVVFRILWLCGQLRRSLLVSPCLLLQTKFAYQLDACGRGGENNGVASRVFFALRAIAAVAPWP